MEHHYFECECSDHGHTVRFVFDESDGELWLETHMGYADPWYKRVWNAIRYVFRSSPAYGHYDVTLFRIEDSARLHTLLDRSEALHRQQTAQTALRMKQDKPLLKG